MAQIDGPGILGDAIKAEGATRGQMIVTGDDVWDLMRTEGGLPTLVAV